MEMMMAVVVVVVVVVVPQEPQFAEEHCKQGSFVNSSRCEGGRGMNSFSPWFEYFSKVIILKLPHPF